MSIKSVIADDIEVAVKPYPKLMVSKVTNNVYLMSSHSKGITVNLSTLPGAIGDEDQFSVGCVDKHFEDFNGTIELSNE